MQLSRLLAAAAGCILLLAEPARAASEITEPRLRAVMDELAAATLQGGAGWQAYARRLHPDYSRWAMGEAYEDREAFVRNLRAWWEHGMRVTSRDIEIVGFDLAGDIAIVRFLTRETFAGPDGAAGGFSGHVTNVWVREDGDWWLLAAEIASTAQ
jgi:hypothetical protein